MKKKMKSVAIFLVAFMLSGCGNNEKTYIKDADVGVIMTTPQTGKTIVDTYSKTGKRINRSKYRYGDIGSWGEITPQVNNGIAYERALGNDFEVDLGAVFAFDLKKDSYKKIDFDRINITDVCISGDNLYCVSNLNCITYFDCYNLKTKKKSTFEWKDGTGVRFSIRNDMIYVVDAGSGRAYQLDFSKKKMVQICNFNEYFHEDFEEGFLVADDDSLYMTSYNHSLVSVNLHNKKIETKDFGFATGGELIMRNGALYISSVYPVTTSDKSIIVKYDIKTKKQLAEWKFDYCIRQFDVRDNEIFVLSEEPYTLNKYKESGETLKREYRTYLPEEKDDYRYSSFWCLR